MTNFRRSTTNLRRSAQRVDEDFAAADVELELLRGRRVMERLEVAWLGAALHRREHRARRDEAAGAVGADALLDESRLEGVIRDADRLREGLLRDALLAARAGVDDVGCEVERPRHD